jgi:hypothetical protein
LVERQHGIAAVPDATECIDEPGTSGKIDRDEVGHDGRIRRRGGGMCVDLPTAPDWRRGRTV